MKQNVQGAAKGVAGPRADRRSIEASGEAANLAGIRRLICVSANPAIDKIARVDRLVPGEIHRAELLTMLPGGKALNVARAASRLGVSSSVVAIFAGHAGAWMADELATRGIRARAVAAPGETRTCLSVLDDRTGSLTEFYEAGSSVDAATWEALEDALAAEVEVAMPGALVVISGSLQPGAPSDGCRRLAAVASGAGAAVAIDAGGPQLRAALQERPSLVKINAVEAAEATGLPTSDERGALRAALALCKAGAGATMVTRGPKGAVLASDEGAWRIGPPPAIGAFSVGSGDAFLAGMIAALAAGLDLPSSARRGAAVAAANAIVPGQGEFDPSIADSTEPQIALERIG